MRTGFISKVIFDWGVRCFGVDHMFDRKIRALRLVEEAVEMAQAHGVDEIQLRRLVTVVYDKPKGDPFQELGGVLVTALAMAACMSVDPDDALETEVHRCLSKTPEHFRERNQKKLEAGL